MTSADIRAALAALSPEHRQIVTEAALVVRAAQAAGDTRPAAQIAAHVLARLPSKPAH